MEIELHILNPENFKESKTINPDEDLVDNTGATWYARHKSYKSDTMDEDMLVSPIGHKIDRAILTDIQVTSKKQVNDIIQFLENLKPTLTH